MTGEITIIKNAIKALREGEFNSRPLPEFRDKEHVFETETCAIVHDEGLELKWLNTFKGGCWHLIPA